MSIKDLCINCFQSTGGEEVCMHCGYIQSDTPKQICHLYPHTVLHDRYVIGKVINNGGFGVVYKAFDTRLETVVAIKELLPTQNSMVTRMPPSQEVIAVNDEKREHFNHLKLRFMEEARVMAQFSSCDSIVRIFDFFEINNTAYLVMEYLDGQTLREYIDARGKRMDYNDAMRIMSPVMEAVKVVHSNNVIHKDISADNIFVCNDGRVKLIDFGAALFGDSTITADEGAVVMKPGYTPPEQYRMNAKIGPQTDIYAVGAVLYTILSGEVPDESIDRIEKDNLQRLSKFNVDAPVCAQKSIMKAMALKESARFKTMDDFINAMDGKKKADYPEEELKKRKIMRAVLIVSVFVVMIIAIVLAYVIKTNSSIKPSAAETITLWYVDNGDEAMNKRWQNVADDFEKAIGTKDGKVTNKDYEELKGSKLEVVGIPADGYNEAVKKAFEEGKGPDIYQTLDGDLESYSTALDKLYDAVEESDLHDKEYKYMKSLYKDENRIAVCFDMPVLYTYTENNYVEAPKQSTSLDDLFAASTKVSKFKYPILCNPDASQFAAYSYGDTNEKGDVFKKLDDVSGKVKVNSKSVSTQKAFAANGLAVYYIGFAHEFGEISKSCSLGSNSFTVQPLTGEKTTNTLVFPETFSVSSESTLNQKKMAQLILYFMVSTPDFQKDVIRVNDKGYYMPLLDEKNEDGSDATDSDDRILALYDSENDVTVLPLEKNEVKAK